MEISVFSSSPYVFPDSSFIFFIMVVNVSKDLSVRVQCEIDHAINNGKKVYYMYNDNEELSDIP